MKQVEDWVHSFLLGSGNNKALSDGLRLQQRWWHGPVRLSLDSLAPCCGPDEGMEYVVERTTFELYTSKMADSIVSGWQPPPLIAMYTADGRLSLRDGNHRYAALRKLGVSEHEVIIWFNSEKEYEAYREGCGKGHQGPLDLLPSLQ